MTLYPVSAMYALPAASRDTLKAPLSPDATVVRGPAVYRVFHTVPVPLSARYTKGLEVRLSTAQPAGEVKGDP